MAAMLEDIRGTGAKSKDPKQRKQPGHSAKFKDIKMVISMLGSQCTKKWEFEEKFKEKFECSAVSREALEEKFEQKFECVSAVFKLWL